MTTKSHGYNLRQFSFYSQSSDLPVLGLLTAEYDYTALTKEDLTFQKGDEILVIKVMDSNWWLGRLRGQVGMFQINYMRRCQTLSALKQQRNQL